HLNTNPWSGAGGLQDSTQNGNDADGTNSSDSGTLTSAGKIGSAVEFDGINDRVKLSNDASLVFGSNRYLSAWVYGGPFVPPLHRNKMMTLFEDANGGCDSVAWRIGSKGQSSLVQRIGHEAGGTTPSENESSGS